MEQYHYNNEHYNHEYNNENHNNHNNHNNYNNQEAEVDGAKITVVGVGGAGGNAINYILDKGIEKVRVVAVNTDYQDLRKCKCKEENKVSLSNLGAGGIPEKGRAFAEEMKKEIKKSIEGQDMIFVTAGMGGGTGTGAAPVIAEIAKELGILTVGIVTKPFNFEGKKRMLNAEKGVEELKKHVDAIVVIPNENLFGYTSSNHDLAVTGLYDTSNEVLYQGIKGVIELITKPGFINLDFSDIKNVLEKAGEVLIGLAEIPVDQDILLAVESAIRSQLTNKSIEGAKKMLISITSPANALTVPKFVEITNKMQEYGDIDTKLGLIVEDSNVFRITVIASGYETDKIVSIAEQTTNTYNSDIENSKTIDIPILD